MAVFANLVDGLKRAERELEAQLKGVRAAISSLASGEPAVSAPGRRRGRAARQQAGTPVAAVVATASRKERKPMSAEARAKIAAAQRARWAKHRARKNK